jgi:hypothetical protein
VPRRGVADLSRIPLFPNRHATSVPVPELPHLRLCEHGSKIISGLRNLPDKTPLDTSDLYILLLTITPQASCKGARDWLVDYGTRKPTELCTIEAVYDLYGPIDLLVKVRATTTKEIEKQIFDGLGEKYLGTKTGRRYAHSSEPIDILQEIAAGNAQAPRQAGPETRGIKAFINFKFPKDIKASIVSSLCGTITEKRHGMVALTAAYLTYDRVIAELFLPCGGYYELAPVIIEIETALAKLAPGATRETLLAMSVWEASNEGSVATALRPPPALAGT